MYLELNMVHRFSIASFEDQLHDHEPSLSASTSFFSQLENMTKGRTPRGEEEGGGAVVRIG